MNPIVLLTVAIVIITVAGTVLITARRVIDPLTADLRTNTAALDLSRSRRQQLCAALISACAEPASSAEGMYSGYVTLAVDVWLGKNFRPRARAVGLSWIPFIAPPEHHETPEITTMRLRRAYRLNDTERAALTAMHLDEAGLLAETAAVIAARIHESPAWHHPFYDDHGVRVDLGREVTTITRAAKALRQQSLLLGPVPSQARAEDPDIVGVYLQKSQRLDKSHDALLDRVCALSDYRNVVSQVQQRLEKQAWLTAAGTLEEDFQREIDTSVHHGTADSIRAAAEESSLFASVYLETLAEPTARLPLDKQH